MNETVTGFEYPVYKEKTTSSSRNLQIMWDINNLDSPKFFNEIWDDMTMILSYKW